MRATLDFGREGFLLIGGFYILCRFSETKREAKSRNPYFDKSYQVSVKCTPRAQDEA
jgi:hypothetical protein